MTWTDERIATLKKCWDDGLSCSQIAAEIGGVSRNAIIGKVHRLGLDRRITGPKTHARRVPSPRRRAMPSFRRVIPDGLQFEATPIEVEPLHIAFEDLRRSDCRYPYGDRDFTFCGHPKHGPLSFCLAHARLCYQPARKRA